MVVVALAMLRDYDIRFQNTIASDLPSFLVNPSEELEETAAARTALAGLRGGSVTGSAREATGAAPETGADGQLGPAGARPGA